MFSIDHAAFNAQLEALWNLINSGGFFNAFLSLFLLLGIWNIVSTLFDKEEGRAPTVSDLVNRDD